MEGTRRKSTFLADSAPKTGSWPEDDGITLDRLDLRIIGSLQGVRYQPNIRKSALAISRELGVDEATVRNRMKRWETSGFLIEYSATIGAPVHGQTACLLRFDVSPTSIKEEVIRRVRLIDGVYRIKDYLGAGLAVSLFFDNNEELKRRTNLVSTVTGAGRMVRSIGSMLPRTPKPDATDLLILGAVAWSTRKSLASVANATGLSAKTVRRRLDRMIEGATLGTGLFLDFRAVKGTLVCDLCVTYKDEKLKADVDRRILSFVGDRLFPPVYPQSVGIFRLLLRSPNEQRDLLRRVKSLEGVSSAFVDVLVEDFYVVETFYAMERRMVKEVAAENRLDPKARRLWKAAWGPSTDVLYPRDFGTRGSRSS